MLTFDSEPCCPSETKPKLAADIQQNQKVLPNKFWKITYQLGPKRGFGKAFPSQSWKERQGGLPGEEKVYDPVYLVFDQVVSSDCANGVIESSNEWQKANVRQRLEGEVNRMVAVLDVKEMKDYLPPNVNFLHGGMPMQVLQMIVDSAVEQRLKSK